MRRACNVATCLAYAQDGHGRCPEHLREVTLPRQARKNRARRDAPGNGAAARIRGKLNKLGAGVCNGCGNAFPASSLAVDHIVPLADGGMDVESNLQLLCVATCHRGKTIQENRERGSTPQGRHVRIRDAR